MSLITGAITLPAQAVSGEPLAGFVGIAINGSDQLVIVNSAGAVGTFALTFGKTLTVTNSLTLTGTDGASVNLDRLANLATGKVLGRTTAGTGAVEALSISGTGSVAMTTSPSFTTPSLGAATAASINGERIGSASSGSRYFSTQGGNAYANLEGNAPGFGFIDTSATLGTNGGYIKTAGGTSGAGGNIDTSGSGSAAGGSINTTAGGSITTGTGGYINTGTNGPIATGTNGPIATGTGGYINTGTGGYINTGTGGYIDTSTGFIVLGDDGVNRTALISLTGANRTINLPDTGGVTKTLAVTTDITGGTLAGSFTTLAGTSSLTLGVGSATAGTIVLRNATNAFTTTVVPGVVAANRQLNLPVITATDTVAVLGLAQTFSGVKTFSAAPVIPSGNSTTPGFVFASSVGAGSDSGLWDGGATGRIGFITANVNRMSLAVADYNFASNITVNFNSTTSISGYNDITLRRGGIGLLNLCAGTASSDSTSAANGNFGLGCSRYTPTTVANLPASPAAGWVAAVNDASAPAVGSTVAGGGAAFALVCHNGSAWKVLSI